MKTVFSSNSQVCHVWAQQNQAMGRAGSIFFRDSMIFSYGDHYPMAKIHRIKTRRIALINSHNYSTTTEHHKNRVRKALSDLMNYFESPDIYSLSAAVKLADSRAKDSITRALKKMTIPGVNTINYVLEDISDAYQNANDLRSILKKSELKIPSLVKVKAHLHARLARYDELNTPEMKAKRAIESQKRLVKKKAAKVAEFRLGNRLGVYGLPFEVLRIQGKILKTSSGAEVPLREATRLWRALVAGSKVVGLRVGHFTINAVTHLATDTVVQIGCNKILLSEATSVLGARPRIEAV